MNLVKIYLRLWYSLDCHDFSFSYWWYLLHYIDICGISVITWMKYLMQGELLGMKILKLHLWKNVDLVWIKDMGIHLINIFSYYISPKPSSWTLCKMLSIINYCAISTGMRVLSISCGRQPWILGEHMQATITINLEVGILFFHVF